MTFNNAFLMELPWETVIKMYRSTVPQNGFKKLYDYVDSFISFIENNQSLFPNDMRERFVTSFIYSAFISVRSEIDN